MMGLAEIVLANEDPDAFKRGELTDGQARWNDSPPSNYWSENEPNAPQNIAEMQLAPGTLRKLQMSRLVSIPYQYDLPEPSMIMRDGVVIGGKDFVPNMPAIYFDGVRLQQALAAQALEAHRRLWRLETALRNVKEARSEYEAATTTQMLSETIAVLNREVPELHTAALVEELLRTIDHAAPPDPLGYVPHMGLHHAMHPIRKLAKAIADTFKRR